MPERAFYLQELALADKHVAEGEKHLARQRQIIASLTQDGHPVDEAVELLQTLEVSQRLHVESRDRLLQELKSRPS
jgi:hypothetical protein